MPVPPRYKWCLGPESCHYLSILVSQIDNCIIITFLDQSLIQDDFIAWFEDLPGIGPAVEHRLVSTK